MLSPITGEPVTGIVIESNGEDDWVELETTDPDKLSTEEVLTRIKEAGIVGLGGAAFPTHVKLTRPPESPVHTIIVNGAECEPYITADDQLMLESTERVLRGLKIIMRALAVDRAYIAIEDNKPKAIEQMSRAVSEGDLPGQVTVAAVEAKYPMGAEKTLVKAILGTEVPEGGFPTDIGVVVQNVATLAAVTDAVVDGRPLVERVVTVTGMVSEPKNLLARIGTPASHLIAQCGGADTAADELIFGGPMMGIAQASLETPTVKSTNCILVKQSDIREERGCIRCGRCVESCPMSLMPLMYVNHVKQEQYEGLTDYYISSCVECGACAYDCPANIPIVSYVKVGKAELRKREAA
jgi:electron transport complex protein RnfC